MTEKEAQNIIEDTLKSHWPAWVFEKQEFVVWVQELRKFDFETTKTAINELYKSWKGEHYPKMAQIMAAIRQYAQTRHRAAPLAKLYQIEDEVGKPVWKPFWGPSGIARQEIEPEAERLCQEADRMFPGQKHITRWFKDDGSEERGYDGPDAKDRAFEAILNGPDCGAKRWLERYLTAKERGKPVKNPRTAALAAMKQEPVAIGKVVDDIPF